MKERDFSLSVDECARNYNNCKGLEVECFWHGLGKQGG